LAFSDGLGIGKLTACGLGRRFVKINDTVKGCGVFLLIVAAYFGWCYFVQRGQHQWVSDRQEAMAAIPGARLISSFKGGDLINPVSWFWPAEYTLVYARPDLSTSEPRFFIMLFNRDESGEEPAIWLTAVDCQARTEVNYRPTREGRGEAALSALGEPLTTPDGRVYRRHDTGVSPAPENIRAFCEMDWARERQAVAGS
jgi:hypothetical protein